MIYVELQLGLKLVVFIVNLADKNGKGSFFCERIISNTFRKMFMKHYIGLCTERPMQVDIGVF